MKIDRFALDVKSLSKAVETQRKEESTEGQELQELRPQNRKAHALQDLAL